VREGAGRRPGPPAGGCDNERAGLGPVGRSNRVRGPGTTRRSGEGATRRRGWSGPRQRCLSCRRAGERSGDIGLPDSCLGPGRRPGRTRPSVARNQRLPLRVLPDLRFPALSLLPGQMPVQEAAWAAVGKRLMSSPSSARICSALRRATPVMVSSRSSTVMNGRVCTSIRPSKRAICWSRNSMWLNRPWSMKAWWSVTRPTSASRSCTSFFRKSPRASAAS